MDLNRAVGTAQDTKDTETSQAFTWRLSSHESFSSQAGRKTMRWPDNTLSVHGPNARAEQVEATHEPRFCRVGFPACPAMVLLVLGFSLAAGCVSKSKARLQAEAAYQAGQKQAIEEQQQRRVERANPQAPATTVRFRGAVRNPAIEWTAGLTLSKAIVQAEYSGLGDPRIILLHRQGQTHTIRISRLLSGVQDPVLEPGDAVDLVP